MAQHVEQGPSYAESRAEAQAALAGSWRALNRAATFVAILTSPALFLQLHLQAGFQVWSALVLTVIAVAAFRGLVDVITRRFIPWPSLFGAEQRVLEDDVVARRRVWFWRRWYRLLVGFVLVSAVLWAIFTLFGRDVAFPFGAWTYMYDWFTSIPGLSSLFIQSIISLPLFLVVNIGIFFGPMLLMAVRGIKSYEPGDADWGVRIDHVRGQAEAKREITRIIDLWEAGEEFESAGGKRERGMLFLGPPGTGKTMLAKAIATGFNSPFVTIAGSGFAQMFLGMDVIVVQILAHRAKKLARKWGGTCIVFIDEIDAVGMRRASLGRTPAVSSLPTLHDYCYHGPSGAISAGCGLVIESEAWRERQFADRAEAEQPSVLSRISTTLAAVPGGLFTGGGSGQALNALLVVMDGIDDPPMMRRWTTNKVNTILDALYVIPHRIGRVRLRLPKPQPRGDQVYFIGACNVPIQQLDPALTRAGRMGRHIRFRTPIKDDRVDIFDFYLAKVAHDPELDTPKAREEFARITGGYSPAMIEQACSTALTYAQHDGRRSFARPDLLEAMTTIEAGMAVDVTYVESETRATALHEAGHAAASHVYSDGHESARLSIRMRGGSLGHHRAIAKEERFSSFQSDEMADLIHIMGAIATEQVFYGQNSNGVTGDMNAATTLACMMVGAYAMAPQRIDFGDRFPRKADEDAARKRIMDRFDEIGSRLLSVATVPPDLTSVLRTPDKRRAAAQLLGEAYFIAHVFVLQNRDRIEKVAERLIERRELYGDDVVELLDEVELQPAVLDYTQERTWPRL
jgi:ATP-dependent Zn protease